MSEEAFLPHVSASEVRARRVIVPLSEVEAVHYYAGGLFGLAGFCRIRANGRVIQVRTNDFGEWKAAMMAEEVARRAAAFAIFACDFHRCLLAARPDAAEIRFTEGHRGGVLLGVSMLGTALFVVLALIYAMIGNLSLWWILVVPLWLCFAVILVLPGVVLIAASARRSYDPKTISQPEAVAKR